MNFRIKIIAFLIALLALTNVSAQVNDALPSKTTPSTEEVKDTTDNPSLKIRSADNQLYDATGDDERFIMVGNVRISHDSTYMFADRAVLINGVTMQANGNISILKNDTIRVFSDSLNYESDSLMAYFVGNVVLEDGSQQLFTSFLQYDLERDWAIYNDTALLVTDGMKIKSRRGIFHLDENYVNFYDKVTIEGTDFDLLSDSLRYYTELKRAVFLSPTIINQGEKRIYSESGFYDIGGGKSEFSGNAQFVEGDKISTADTIRNDSESNLTELIGNAVYKSQDEIGRADKIISHTDTDEIELIGNAYFKNPDNEVSGSTIFFNKTTGAVKVSGRSVLSNPPFIIEADDLDYNKDTGAARADGNVTWTDTSSNYQIICDHARYIDSTDFMRAYNDVGKPVLKNEISEGDTLLLSGDTLISYTVTMGHDSIGIDTHRFFQAFANVEMINKDMQAIADSLSYNGRDSIFSLFGSPVMWSDSSQYSGDTIKISMVDNEIEKVKIDGSALILTSSDYLFFDQIKGKLIIANFVQGNIDRMRVDGGAQSVYYMKDEEQAYMSVNETTCSNMTFLFDEGELWQTRYYKEPTSKMTPMKMADHEAIKLPGFRWMMDLRPMTIDDLYN